MSTIATLAFLCMTLVIHEEAQGEPMLTKVNVGHVVMNRIESRQYPDSCEAVVLQPYQFAWTRNKGIKDGTDLLHRYFKISDNLSNPLVRESFRQSQVAAKRVLERRAFDNRGRKLLYVGGALHFVSKGHKTKWTSSFSRRTVHGIDFLKPKRKRSHNTS